ncbi:MAG: ATP-binding protein [Pseudobdellovibrionaceae bacterium]
MVFSDNLRKNEISRYRMLALNGALAYPIWGFLIQEFDPAAAQDSLLVRFIFTAFALGLLAGSFFVPRKLQYLENCVIICGWFLVLHSAWIAWASHLSYLIFAGFLVLTSCLLNIFPTKKSSWILGFTLALLGLVVFAVENQWIVPPMVVNVALWSTVATSLSANYLRIQHLSSLLGAREELEILFENMKEGVVVYGPKGQIRGSNLAARIILGMSRKQLLELNPLSPTWTCLKENGQTFTADNHPVSKAIHEKSEFKDVVMGVRKPDGGAAWIKVSGSSFAAAAGDHELSTIVTFSDIGEMKKSQKIILEQQSRLEATAKLTALGEMAAGVAHEINNPLAIILGKVFLIRKALQTQKMEPIEECLEKISKTVERIQRIVKGLQTFATGGEQDPFQKINLKDLVEDAISYCQDKIERNKVQIQLDFNEDIALECRPIQMSQVLVNLIQNSCDAIENRDDRWIRIWGRSAHEILVLTVTDSGPGIPEDLQKKLMQPFFTTKEVGKGTGLGLSITKGLINSHMGRFWLNSSAPHTSFVIELPLHQQAQKKAA